MFGAAEEATGSFFLTNDVHRRDAEGKLGPLVVTRNRLGPAVSSGAAFLGVEKGRRLLQHTAHREQNDTIPPCFSGQWREEWRTALFWLCQYLSPLASSCLLPFGSEGRRGGGDGG